MRSGSIKNETFDIRMRSKVVTPPFILITGVSKPIEVSNLSEDLDGV